MRGLRSSVSFFLLHPFLCFLQTVTLASVGLDLMEELAFHLKETTEGLIIFPSVAPAAQRRTLEEFISKGEFRGPAEVMRHLIELEKARRARK